MCRELENSLFLKKKIIKKGHLVLSLFQSVYGRKDKIPWFTNASSAKAILIQTPGHCLYLRNCSLLAAIFIGLGLQHPNC